MIKDIQTNLNIHPKYYSKHIKENVLDILTVKMDTLCDEQNGYILQVMGVKHLEHIRDHMFRVIFIADTFKPVIGMTIKGTVCMIFKDGVFIDIMNRQKLLIPNSFLHDYKFDSEHNTYTSESHTITIGDIIDVEITNLKFTNNKYSCIGKLV